MKTQITIGEEKKNTKISRYKNGVTIIESGDPFSQTYVKNAKPVEVVRTVTTKDQLEQIKSMPKNWILKNGKLKRVAKKPKKG